jgi:hypothetical protein
MYISASLTTSLAGLAVTSNFDDVGLPARRRSPSKVPSGFAHNARLPLRPPTRLPRHRQWMIRSYALAPFFVTFGIARST